jgi:hypothetical protein
MFKAVLREINDFLTRKICRDLQTPKPNAS